jgi:hypothetical protein
MTRALTAQNLFIFKVESVVRENPEKLTATPLFVSPGVAWLTAAFALVTDLVDRQSTTVVA